MAGLLDVFNSDEGRSGVGLLAASGGRFGPGFLGLLGQLQSDEDRKIKQAYIRSQIAENESQNRARDQQFKAAQAEQELAKRFYQPGSAAIPGTAGDPSAMILPSAGRSAVPASFDARGYANALASLNPAKGVALLQSLQKDNGFDKIDPKAFTPASLQKFAQTNDYSALQPRDKLEFVEGVGVNPYDMANANRSLPNPNKPFSMDASGNPVANRAFQQYELNKAAAGAARNTSNVTLNTEKNLLSTIANGIGGQINASLEGAKSAANTINTLNNLDAALNSGKVMAGPATKPAQLMMQLGTQLGLGGKTADETLQKTRAAMQAMAQLELDAAGQMKGQGQITESEREILRKAASGDISMSLAEIKTLSNVSRRTAQMRIAQHNQNIQPLLANPNGAAVAPFLTVQQPQGGGQSNSNVINFTDLK